MSRITAQAAGGHNVVAFLDMIAHSEGTAGHGEDGYNVLVGGGLFHSYADHPRTLVDLPNLGIKSTAAGRYQILAKFYDDYKKSLHLPDFGPLSQDRIAIQMIHEQRAMPAVLSGHFSTAVYLCANIWASLPSNDYGQHQNKLQQLVAFYKVAGGKLA